MLARYNVEVLINLISGTNRKTLGATYHRSLLSKPSLMHRERRNYAAYMLRLWFENDDSRDADQTLGVWRASLEDPTTREMQVFTDLESLYAFLVGETEHVEEVEEISARPGD